MSKQETKRADGIYMASPRRGDSPTRENNSRWISCKNITGVAEYPISTADKGAYCTNCLQTHRPRFTHAYYPIIKGESLSSWICQECAVRVGLIW